MSSLRAGVSGVALTFQNELRGDAWPQAIERRLRVANAAGNSGKKELLLPVVGSAAAAALALAAGKVPTLARGIGERVKGRAAVEGAEEEAEGAWEGVKERIPGMGRKRERQR